MWLLSLWLVLLGTYKAILFFWRKPELPLVRREPISILKPLKGAEVGLRENLETFFVLEYPHFEMIFSVAEADDPARAVVEDLLAKYPAVNARIMIGATSIGPNPKVNNLIRSYEQAANNWILISDSNVRVPKDYLMRTTDEFTTDVGVVTGLVAGVDGRGIGGKLEAIFLNTFYARWMFLAAEFGQDCVVGKSMLFRKTDANRFGGFLQLGRFLAEDFMTGQAMRMLGLRVVMMRKPIEQPVSHYAFKQFWNRHLRWGRIRKSQAPLPVMIEPWFNMIPSGLLGAYAVQQLTEVPHIFAGVFFAHLLCWFAVDAIQMKALGQKLEVSTFFAWVLREVLALPLWIQMCCGTTVMWRGNRLRVKTGGLLETAAA